MEEQTIISNLKKMNVKVRMYFGEEKCPSCNWVCSIMYNGLCPDCFLEKNVEV